MTDTFSTTESDWQGVDDVPTAESDNLVKSGGLYKIQQIESQEIQTNINTGYFIESTGVKQSSSNFAITDVIELMPGRVISLYAAGYSTRVSMISEYNENDESYKPLCLSIDSELRFYNYRNKGVNPVKIVLSFNVTKDYHFVTTSSIVNYDINNLILPSEVVCDGILVNDYQKLQAGYYKKNDNVVNLNITESSNFRCIKFPITVGNVYKVYGYHQDNHAPFYVLCDLNGLVLDSSNTVGYNEKTIIVEQNGYLLINVYYVHTDFYCYINTLAANSSLSALGHYFLTSGNSVKTIDIATAIEGKYLDGGGIIQNGSSFRISEPIKLLRGQKIILTAAGYHESVSLISIVKDNYYEPAILSIDDDIHDYEFTALESCFVVLSFKWYNSSYSAVIVSDFLSEKIVSIEDNLSALIQKTDIEYCRFFRNVLFVGDSLTKGVDGAKTDGSVTPYNYPYYLARKSNFNFANEAISGYTAKQWWDTKGEIINYSDYDAAIIYLGTNGGLTDTVDTDINIEDYTQNADNNTGCYGKIIAKIKEESPSAKIYLIAGPNEYVRRETTMNPAVRALANIYNVNLIDLENCKLSDNGRNGYIRYHYRPADGIHYNDLGYFVFSELVFDSISLIDI